MEGPAKISYELCRYTHECIVCYNGIGANSTIWNCSECQIILHFKCITKWADGKESWKCPNCQSESQVNPQKTVCFCKKSKDFEVDKERPFCCEAICLSILCTNNHPCPLRCHPGKCPPCESVSPLNSCFCGKQKMQLRCSDQQMSCESICGKVLNCGIHRCQDNCHRNCDECKEEYIQTCFCGKHERLVKCKSDFFSENVLKKYSCSLICGKTLSCGNHKCEQVCHEDECGECIYLPSNVKTCPCGKILCPERHSCLDEIPNCDSECLKKLNCGHFCESKCHSGECKACDKIIEHKCECGKSNIDSKCGTTPKCIRSCSQLMSCRKHVCKEKCCILESHDCLIPCNRELNCKIHKCPFPCHIGQCVPCFERSEVRLSCFCGNTFVNPPVPCGTLVPECEFPCIKHQSCSHQHSHKCHQGDCPRCPVLTKKSCACKKQELTVPCWKSNLHCLEPCMKELSCGHFCSKVCHVDECMTNCAQKCNRLRECGHKCQAACHPKCNTECKEIVSISCECGIMQSNFVCSDLPQRLECGDPCLIHQRNIALAEALQINPSDGAESNSQANYSDEVLLFYRDNKHSIRNLIKQFNSFLNSSRYRLYLEPMSSKHRKVVYEMAEMYGFDTETIDEEQYRSVVLVQNQNARIPEISIIEAYNRSRF